MGRPVAIVALFAVMVKTCAGVEFKDSIVATTEQGNVLGSVRVNRKGGKFYSFTSIPYAKPPLGDLRFMPPEDPEPWNGVLNATVEPPSCYQLKASRAGQFITIGSEDCLYLNVFTRTLPTEDEDLKPVMVYLHGGGFVEGSSRTEFYGPDFLMTEHIVLVTLNYRLGILGFLSAEDESLGVTGNGALKDQVMALKWINKNIQYFGGDPESVTIFGESAGAACVELHTLSAQSQGLFHKAIMESGSVLNGWSNGIKGNIKILAEQMGLQTEDENDILTTLKSLPVEQLHFEYDTQINYLRQNAPVVETQTDGAFLPAEPRKLLENGNFVKVPTMIGYNSDEGLFKHAYGDIDPDTFEVDWTEFVPSDLDPHNDTEVRASIARDISEFYLSSGYADKIKMDIDAFTDANFLYGIYTSLKARLATCTSPIYFYRFSMSSKLNLVKNSNPATANRTGAAHTEDLNYLFKDHSVASIVPGSLEDKNIYKMVKLWTNFAIYGNPTARTDSVLNVVWPAANRRNINYLEIGNEFRVGKYPDKDRVVFWEWLYDKYYKK